MHETWREEEKMRDIHTEEVVQVGRDMAMRSATDLGQDVLDALHKARTVEESPIGVDILDRLIENVGIAKAEKIPMCHDTGMAVVFVEMGQEVHITGGSLTEAINEGARRGHADGYLRQSVCDPITRENTGDNTPAVIHLELVKGDRFKITFMSKGFGAENMSLVTMLPPAAGIDGARDVVVQRIAEAGPNPCPPYDYRRRYRWQPGEGGLAREKGLGEAFGNAQP
jgi:fumarate hydratase subunit alpha